MRIKVIIVHLLHHLGKQPLESLLGFLHLCQGLSVAFLGGRLGGCLGLPNLCQQLILPLALAWPPWGVRGHGGNSGMMNTGGRRAGWSWRGGIGQTHR